MTRSARLLLLAMLPAILAGCEAQKSSNPLSATVAGPIPGVNITPPQAVEPSQGTKVPVDRQPITLTVDNAQSNGPRPLSYVFEVATDAEFKNKVFIRSGIVPGDGRTSLRLPDPLAPERSYYWRSRAEDGANDSPFSPSTNFAVFTPIVINPPVLLSPHMNEKVTTRRPTLTVANATKSGPVGPIRYEIQVSELDSFATLFADLGVDEQPGQTSMQFPFEGPLGKYFFWRARAMDATTVGPWSTVGAFLMPDQPTSPGAPGKPCGPPYPNTGDGLVACISNQYPDKLVAGVSLDQRRVNMAFLRDRMIETGICGGMDLGWNRKGNGETTLDGLAWVTGGQPYFVDIGQAFDDTTRPLRLIWNQGSVTGGYVTYTPRPTCN